ncbi:MAG: hypothetical protein IKN43_14075 [Selenomonadaceae bacterium]|nr:hypothetical protein [Selenomonadaceae bacterium]
MATESFEKDFIVTDKQAPLWEKALAYFENRKVEWTPIRNAEMTDEEFDEFMDSIK